MAWAAGLDVSLDYLVSEPEETTPAGPYCRDPTAHKVVEELGLEDLLLVYKIGSGGVDWEIVVYLARSYPDPVPYRSCEGALPGFPKSDSEATCWRSNGVTSSRNPAMSGRNRSMF